MPENKKRSTTIKIALWMEKKLLAKVISDGYGMRGKSKWVEEAVLGLLQMPEYCEDVNWDTISEGDTFDKTCGLSFFVATLEKIDDAVEVVRKQYPRMEGVQSKIIRTAILKRIVEGAAFAGRTNT